MLQRLNKPDSAASFELLWNLSVFFDYYYNNNFPAALELLNMIAILPNDSAAVHLREQAARAWPDALKRNLGPLLLAAMTCIHRIHATYRQAGSSADTERVCSSASRKSSLRFFGTYFFVAGVAAVAGAQSRACYVRGPAAVPAAGGHGVPTCADGRVSEIGWMSVCLSAMPNKIISFIEHSLPLAIAMLPCLRVAELQRGPQQQQQQRRRRHPCLLLSVRCSAAQHRRAVMRCLLPPVWPPLHRHRLR